MRGAVLRYKVLKKLHLHAIEGGWKKSNSVDAQAGARLR
jgi:hypothetical protein